MLHDRLDIREVPALTSKDYRCSGCTALLDAIGGAIKHIDLVQGILPREYRADSVLFVITTDGMENASRNYSLRKVRHMIERHQEMGWEFLFIGANIDAIGEAGRLGIARNMPSTTWPTPKARQRCTRQRHVPSATYDWAPR